MSDTPIAIADVKRLVVAAGDTIVIRLDRSATSEEMTTIQTTLRASLAVDVNVIVLDHSVTMEVVERRVPDAPPPAPDGWARDEFGGAKT